MQQPRPDKGQPQQNRLASPGARSTAPAGTKDLDCDKMQKTLSKKERISRVREQLRLWYGPAAHNCKECTMPVNKESMRTAAQEMRLQQPARKTRSKEKTKQKPEVAIGEQLDLNRVFVQVNGHPALALIELQTIAGDLISAQFVYLCKLPVVQIEPKTLASAIKESKVTVDKTCKVALTCGGYE